MYIYTQIHSQKKKKKKKRNLFHLDLRNLARQVGKQFTINLHHMLRDWLERAGSEGGMEGERGKGK
jgi:hypothetical protein